MSSATNTARKWTPCATPCSPAPCRPKTARVRRAEARTRLQISTRHGCWWQSDARAAGGTCRCPLKYGSKIFYGLHRLMAAYLPDDHLSGVIEADECCHGGVLKGKRDQGAASKTTVFGLPRRRGRVYTAANSQCTNRNPVAHCCRASQVRLYRNLPCKTVIPMRWRILGAEPKGISSLRRHHAQTLPLLPEGVRMAVQ